MDALPTRLFSALRFNPRKVVALGWVCLLWAGLTVAQPPEKDESYPRLKAVLDRLPDTTRIERLIRFHEQKSNRYQFGEARQALDEALKTAERLPDRERIARVYLALGQWYGKQNNYLQALRQYQRALLNLKGPRDAERMYQLYVQIGHAYQHTLELKNAEFYYTKIIRAHTPQASLLDQSQAYGGLANLADQQHDARKALYYNQKALAIAEQLGRWDDYYNKLANIAFN